MRPLFSFDAFQKKVVGAWNTDYKDNGESRRVIRQYS